eukprot:217615-Chlamydomonas_euryale.AAC.1
MRDIETDTDHAHAPARSCAQQHSGSGTAALDAAARSCAQQRSGSGTAAPGAAACSYARQRSGSGTAAPGAAARTCAQQRSLHQHTQQKLPVRRSGAAATPALDAVVVAAALLRRAPCNGASERLLQVPTARSRCRLGLLISS